MEQKINHFACEHCTHIWPECNAYYCELELDDNYDREHCEYYKYKPPFVDKVGTFEIKGEKE